MFGSVRLYRLEGNGTVTYERRQNDRHSVVYIDGSPVSGADRIGTYADGGVWLHLPERGYYEIARDDIAYPRSDREHRNRADVRPE